MDGPLSEPIRTLIAINLPTIDGTAALPSHSPTTTGEDEINPFSIIRKQRRRRREFRTKTHVRFLMILHFRVFKMLSSI